MVGDRDQFLGNSIESAQHVEAFAPAAASNEAHGQGIQIAQEGQQNEMRRVNEEQMELARLRLLNERLQGLCFEGVPARPRPLWPGFASPSDAKFCFF